MGVEWGMFDRVMHWLEAEPTSEDDGFSSSTVRLCVASLFYHLIAADGEVKLSEQQRMRSLLQTRFGLSDETVNRLEKEAEESDESTAGLFPFAVILNRELDQSERERVVEQLRSLALADGVLHPRESSVIDHVKQLLKL
ncbi:MAG: TerB family tellurite resistance protein [Pseudomonadota bacterium]